MQASFVTFDTTSYVCKAEVSSQPQRKSGFKRIQYELHRFNAEYVAMLSNNNNNNNNNNNSNGNSNNQGPSNFATREIAKNLKTL